MLGLLGLVWEGVGGGGSFWGCRLWGVEAVVGGGYPGRSRRGGGEGIEVEHSFFFSFAHCIGRLGDGEG